MKHIKNKKGMELALNQLIWFILLGIFFILVLAWYFGLRDNIVQIIKGAFK